MSPQTDPKNCSQEAGNSFARAVVPEASGTVGNSSAREGKTAGQSAENCSRTTGNSMGTGALLELFPFPPLYSGNSSGTRLIRGA